MLCEIQIDESLPRRWHRQLVNALAAAGHRCRLRPVRLPTLAPYPPALDQLLWLDRTLHGSRDHALDAISIADVTSSDSTGPADAVIDLTGVAEGETAPRHLVPLFDRAPGEAALWSALLDGRAPQLDLFDRTDAGLIPIGLPAIEAPHQLLASADFVVARLIEGIVRTVKQNASGVSRDGQGVRLPPRRPAHCLSALTGILFGKAQRALARGFDRQPQWSVAWRSAPYEQSPLLPDETIDLSGWTFLADDGQRYYADPFVAGDGDRRFIFVEEFPYATGRGLISAVEIDASGRAVSTPAPVLEAPFHLSYPQIIVDGGAIYMLPEAAASGKLTLYRAERLPDRWVEVADVLHEPVHDATICKVEDTYWLSAAGEGQGGSSWDALNLYSAPSMLGPWMPHAHNPVLIDAASARPAGAVASIAGTQYRPAQDCRRGYGAALTVARIDRLDHGAFSQTSVRRLTPPRGFLGLHTWNTGYGLEAIDLFGPRQTVQS